MQCAVPLQTWCGAERCLVRKGALSVFLQKTSDESSLGISLLPLRSVISLLVRGDYRSQMHHHGIMLGGDLQSWTVPASNHFAYLLLGWGCSGWG
jgi:hypothetical protein